MMDKQRYILSSEQIKHNAVNCLEGIEVNKDHPWQIEIKPFEKIRTTKLNSRYWCGLTENLDNIRQAVKVVSDYTGYSPLESRRLIAKEIDNPEQVALLFVKTPEAAHEVIKIICDIPTSTRLGTKYFIQFEERMEQTLVEIVGIINDVSRRMAA